MSSQLSVKQGDSLDFVGVLTTNGVYQDLTGYTVRCSVAKGAFRDALTVVLAAQSGLTLGQFTASATYTQTATWPLGAMACDVEYTTFGQRVSSETFSVVVRESATP